MSPSEWNAPASLPRAIAIRRLGSIVAAVLAIPLIALGAAVAGMMSNAAAVVGLLAGIGAVSWLFSRLWRAPHVMRPTLVRVPSTGELEVSGQRLRVRTCVYDNVDEVLYARGPFAVSVAALKVPPAIAGELVRAIACRERGLFTIPVTPWPLGIPFASLPAMLIAVFLVFVVPALWIALPAVAALGASLVVVCVLVAFFWPSRVRVGDVLEWRWLWRRRAVPFAAVEALSVTGTHLIVHLRDGDEWRIHARYATGVPVIALVEARSHRNLALFAERITRTCVEDAPYR